MEKNKSPETAHWDLMKRKTNMKIISPYTNNSITRIFPIERDQARAKTAFKEKKKKYGMWGNKATLHKRGGL